MKSACCLRYTVIALLFAFTGYVPRSSIGIAAERMVPELGLSQVELGWLFTAFVFPNRCSRFRAP